MPTYTIEQGKETGLVQANVTPKPLILCQIAAVNPTSKKVDSGSDVTYLTTVPDLGGMERTYGGNTYLARLLSNPIDQIQAMSPQGYDIPGSISLEIADGDFSIWTQHANAFGWRGGTLSIVFLLWDAASATYSSNFYLWTFILDKPNAGDDGIIRVSGQARESMTRLQVPNSARQNRCGFSFPPTVEAQLDALINPTSPYYGCGYSADASLVSIGGVGNRTTPNLTNPDGSALTDSAGNYVMCDFSRSCGAGRATRTQGCMARLGNYSATTTFGTGGKPCGADGDIAHDGSNRPTGHFPGDTWVAPQGWSGRQYDNPGAGKQYGYNAPNPPTGTTYYSQGYGTQWVAATVLEPASGSNDLIVECIVCMAGWTPAKVLTVLVNGVEVPAGNVDTADFTYVVRSAGGRASTVSQNVLLDGAGDPHGSTCWLLITVPSELAASGSIPSVQVLVQFPQCLHAYPIATAVVSGSNTVLTLEAGIANNFFAGVVAGQGGFGGGLAPYICGNTGVPDGAYVPVSATVGPPGTITIPGAWSGTGGAVYYYPIATSDDGFTETGTGAVAANPAWALMDLLGCWGPFTVADFDAATWYATAQICAAQISYTNIANAAATHARYRCAFALISGQRQSLANAVLALRNCAGLILAKNPINGKLQCFVEQTLADQQPAQIPGSNYNTPVVSLAADGSTVNGYLAYHFDGSSIEFGTFKLGGRTMNDTPNAIAFPFQDSANAYVQDTITTVDPDGYVSSGNQEINAPFAVLGIDNFDQGTRRSNVELAKALYGNSRFDAGGTELPSFRTSCKAAHLAGRVGFICGITHPKLGLSMVLARLLSATPNSDGEHWDLSFRWHYDVWHTDAYGQDPPKYQRTPQSTTPRPPWPLRPARSAFLDDDALFPGRQTIALYTTSGQITAATVPPVNITSTQTQAPRVPLQAAVGSGGTIAAGSYVISFVGLDAGGLKSQPSINVKAVAGTGSSTFTVSNILWDPAAVTYEEYFGPDDLHMWKVAEGSVASSITIGATALPADGIGRPDTMESSVLVLVTPIRHGGIFGTGAFTIAPNAISLPSSPTTDQWSGRVISLYGSATPIPTGGMGPQTYAGLCYAKPANFNVTGNDTSGTMTVLQSTLISGQPFTFPGDAYVMRAQANIASATTIGDSAFVNEFAPGGLIVNAEYGKVVWIMAGLGEGQFRTIASNTNTTLTVTKQWKVIPDSTSIFVILESAPSLTFPGIAFGNNGLTATDAVLAVMATPFSTLGSQSFLVQAVTQDANGNISPIRYAPWQEVFVPKLTSAALSDGLYPSITPVAGTATIDLANGLNQILVLTATPVTVAAPVSSLVPLVDGAWFTLYLRQDSTGNRSLPTFTHAAGAFCDNVAAVIQYSPDAHCDTPVTFTLRGGFWIPDVPGAHSS